MSVVGREIVGFDDPVCNSFQVQIRNDQLCYAVDLENLKDFTNIEEQIKSGLVLILDLNEERQSEFYNLKAPTKKTNKFRDDADEKMKIYLDTISNFSSSIY